MGTTTETRITSTQAKDAIYKAHSMPSASEIDFNVRTTKTLSLRNTFLPKEKPISTDTATVTTLTATSYTNIKTIGKDDVGSFAIQGANMYVAGTTYPNNLFNISDGTITGLYTVAPYTISFMLYGDSFELYHKEFASSIEVFVNGSQVTKQDITSTGALRFKKVQFASTKLRRIDIRCRNFYFGGFRINATATMFPVATSPKTIIVGDSFVEGRSGATGNLLGFVDAMNWLDKSFSIWASGSGGTGYVNDNTSATRVKYSTRVQADVIANNPDIVVTVGGINDILYTNAEFQQGVDDYYDALVAGLPNAKIVIVSPFYPKDSTNMVAFRNILEAKAIEIGAVFIDSLNVTGTGGWFTGTGKDGSPANNGNADLFISSDGTHPTDAGYLYLGARLYDELVSKGIL